VRITETKRPAISCGNSHGKSVAVIYFYLTAKSGLLREEIKQIKFKLSLVFYLKLYLARKPYTIVLGPLFSSNIF
jgi:hypothetical protein